MPTLRNKPRAQLRRFAALLGWEPLETFQHLIDDLPANSPSRVISWYVCGECEGGRADFFLQLNESPIGQTVTYEGAVFALRFRLFTGWHPFTLVDDTQSMQSEAQRVGEWLKREWFDSPARRREFRARHPQCAGYSWSRIRDG